MNAVLENLATGAVRLTDAVQIISIKILGNLLKQSSDCFSLLVILFPCGHKITQKLFEPSRDLSPYRSCTPFGDFVSLRSQNNSKAFRALEGVADIKKHKQCLSTVCVFISVRPRGLEPRTISLKGSRSTN